MATTKRTFKRVGQRVLVFRWFDPAYRPNEQASRYGWQRGEEFGTVEAIDIEGAASVRLDSYPGDLMRVLTKDCAFRFQDPRAPSTVRARESRASRERREQREKRTEQIHVPLTRTELREVLELARKLDTSVADTIRRAVKELERVTHPPERIAG